MHYTRSPAEKLLVMDCIVRGLGGGELEEIRTGVLYREPGALG
jgi:hypothetical protein